jgi:hypothetical protein
MDMDLSSAFSIYQLKQGNFSHEQLEKGFKNLVKKYHPDKNQEFSDWCHIRMTEINAAYEILMEDLVESQRTKPTNKNTNQEYSKKKSDNSQDLYFSKATALFFKGVHTYYDYELTKRALRQEGVWRYHYRRSVKLIEKSLEEMEKIPQKQTSVNNWNIFIHFCHLFFDDIQSFEPNIPLSMRGSKTHIAYSEATSSIDKAFAGYFGSNPGERERHLSPLYRASKLLILLVENYPQTEWYTLALKKLNLLDSFLDIQDLIRARKITF